MTIIYANQSMGRGGAEAFIQDLLVELEQRGHAIEVHTTHSAFAHELKKSKLAVKRFPWVMDVIGNWKGLIKAGVFGPLAYWEWQRRLKAIVQKNSGKSKPIILLSGFNEKLIVTPLAYELELPIVWIEFSPLQSVLNKWNSKIGQRYLRELQKVDLLITSSKHSKKFLQKELRLTEHSIRVVPCGRAINSKKIAITEPKNPLIVCVSRLEPGKGQDLLLDAMPQILQAVPKAKLAIVGEGDFKPELEQRTRDLGVGRAVTFVGRADDALSWIGKSSVCVFPSMWELEGFGLVVIEAMALGKPVVAFDRGPVNELINHRANGLLADARSSEDLAQNIISVLTQPKLAKKLGEKAKQDFKEKYTITKAADEYERLFKNLERLHG